MKNNKEGNVWFITGAGRGMGLEVAKAALAAGHKVVATGRNAEKVTEVLGKSANLLAVKLDVTKPSEAEMAAKSAVERFGAIDVLVNNAGNFYAGFFEELSIEQIQSQISTNFFGQMIVTRAVLPQMALVAKLIANSKLEIRKSLGVNKPNTDADKPSVYKFWTY